MTILEQGDNSQLNRIESRNIHLHFIFKVSKVLNVGSIAFNMVLQKLDIHIQSNEIGLPLNIQKQYT